MGNRNRSMLVKGGFSTYGQPLGILVFKGITPRIPGDLGHAETLDCNVIYEILDNVSFMDLVNGSERTREELVVAAQRLEAKGVRAIAGDCGLLARYQHEIASVLTIPFISSSLLLIPLIWQIQGRIGKIGLITGHTELLKKEHLLGVGIPNDIPLAIGGMETVAEFVKVVINGAPELNVEGMRDGVIEVCRKLLAQHSDVRSLVLECSNLPPFAKDIYAEFKLPVYDLVGLTKLILNSVIPPEYK